MGGCLCRLFNRSRLEHQDREHLQKPKACQTPASTFDPLTDRTDDVSFAESDSDVDSDLGSECLSLAYDSYCSDIGTALIADSKAVRAQTTTPDERPFICSRLGRYEDSRPDSAQSIDTVHWKKGPKLGRGTFGTVFCGLTVSGEMIAVKQIELNSDFSQAEIEYDRIYEEVCLLKTLKHNNIVSYLGSCYNDNTISVFMEYVPGGTLQSILTRFGPLDEVVSSHYTKQILQALQYLHANNVVHRDIKCANLMLMPDGIIKMVDFGCAKRLCVKIGIQGSNMQKSLRGTPYWMAPEIVNASGHGRKSDIWSLGCTVFEMSTGQPPWAERHPLAAMYAAGSRLPVPHLPDHFSEDIHNFVDACLTKDKLERPTAEKLLLHPYVCKKNKSAKTGQTLTRKQTI